MSVSDQFRTLLDRLQPTPLEQSQYERHTKTVRTRLKAVFDNSIVEQIGSHSRGSAVRSVSDLDLLFRLPVGYARRAGRLVHSDTILKNVRDELMDRYTKTSVRRDGQAVVIGFADGNFSVDLVPAVFEGMIHVEVLRKQRPVYLIPDGNRGWLRTSPSAHNDFIAVTDTTSGGKLTYVAQLLKFWRNCRTPPLPFSSFHIDLVLADSNICAGVKSYSTCVAAALGLLAGRSCRALQDPLGISGLVGTAGTEAKLEKVSAAIAHAASHARSALGAEAHSDMAEAYRQWNIVFNGRFPSR